MRQIIIPILILISVLSLNAQEAIDSRQEIKSPIINSDNTVTFKIHAPNAEEVKISGDFIDQYADKDKENIYFNKDNNGTWEYTTPIPLIPELYCYSIIIDGMKVNDPSNVYLLRDVVSISNIFIIPGQNADLYCINDVPHGSVHHQWHHSDILNMDRRLTIYTPAGYETSDLRYPVLYLHHGMGGDENAWIELGRAVQILDNLIATEKAEPMIVVMPNGNSSQEAAPGETSNNLIQPSFHLPNIQGDYERHFPEIVNYIDSTFRTKTDKTDRAIAGLSMGGMHALYISLNYPDMFDYIGLFSAATMPIGNSDAEIYKNEDTKLKSLFDKSPKLYWIGIGKDDFLYKMNVEFRKKLDTNAYRYTYHESDGGHTWRNWRSYLSHFLPLLFQK